MRTVDERTGRAVLLFGRTISTLPENARVELVPFASVQQSFQSMPPPLPPQPLPVLIPKVKREEEDSTSPLSFVPASARSSFTAPAQSTPSLSTTVGEGHQRRSSLASTTESGPKRHEDQQKQLHREQVVKPQSHPSPERRRNSSNAKDAAAALAKSSSPELTIITNNSRDVNRLDLDEPNHAPQPDSSQNSGYRANRIGDLSDDNEADSPPQHRQSHTAGKSNGRLLHAATYDLLSDTSTDEDLPLFLYKEKGKAKGPKIKKSSGRNLQRRFASENEITDHPEADQAISPLQPVASTSTSVQRHSPNEPAKATPRKKSMSTISSMLSSAPETPPPHSPVTTSNHSTMSNPSKKTSFSTSAPFSKKRGHTTSPSKYGLSTDSHRTDDDAKSTHVALPHPSKRPRRYSKRSSEQHDMAVTFTCDRVTDAMNEPLTRRRRKEMGLPPLVSKLEEEVQKRQNKQACVVQWKDEDHYFQDVTHIRQLRDEVGGSQMTFTS